MPGGCIGPQMAARTGTRCPPPRRRPSWTWRLEYGRGLGRHGKGTGHHRRWGGLARIEHWGHGRGCGGRKTRLGAWFPALAHNRRRPTLECLYGAAGGPRPGLRRCRARVACRATEHAFDCMPPGGIYRTTDGGMTWQEAQPDPAWGRNIAFDQVTFMDAQHGWVTGQNVDLRTTDGGGSWQRIGDGTPKPTPAAGSAFIARSMVGKPVPGQEKYVSTPTSPPAILSMTRAWVTRPTVGLHGARTGSLAGAGFRPQACLRSTSTMRTRAGLSATSAGSCTPRMAARHGKRCPSEQPLVAMRLWPPRPAWHTSAARTASSSATMDPS